MQTVVQPETSFDQDLHPAAPANFDPIAAYRELQVELLALVSWLSGPYPREELVRHAVEESIKLHDAVILAELIEASRPQRILEIGSFFGFSTRWLLEVSRSWGARVVSIDPGIRHRVFDDPAEILRRFTSGFIPTRLTREGRGAS